MIPVELLNVYRTILYTRIVVIKEMYNNKYRNDCSGTLRQIKIHNAYTLERTSDNSSKSNNRAKLANSNINEALWQH